MTTKFHDTLVSFCDCLTIGVKMQSSLFGDNLSDSVEFVGDSQYVELMNRSIICFEDYKSFYVVTTKTKILYFGNETESPSYGDFSTLVKIIE